MTTTIAITGNGTYDAPKLYGGGVHIQITSPGATIAPQVSFGDSDYEPLLTADGSADRTITKNGVIDIATKYSEKLRFVVTNFTAAFEIKAL